VWLLPPPGAAGRSVARRQAEFARKGNFFQNLVLRSKRNFAKIKKKTKNKNKKTK